MEDVKALRVDGLPIELSDIFWKAMSHDSHVKRGLVVKSALVIIKYNLSQPFFSWEQWIFSFAVGVMNLSY